MKAHISTKYTYGLIARCSGPFALKARAEKLLRKRGLRIVKSERMRKPKTADGQPRFTILAVERDKSRQRDWTLND